MLSFIFPIKLLDRLEVDDELMKTNCGVIIHSAWAKLFALWKSKIFSLQIFRTLSFVHTTFLLYALAYFAAGECIEPTIIIVRVGRNNSSDHSRLDRQTDRQSVSYASPLRGNQRVVCLFLYGVCLTIECLFFALSKSCFAEGWVNKPKYHFFVL